MKAIGTKYHKKVVLHEGKFFRFVRRGQWEFYERNNCTGLVIIVPLTRDGNVIFVEQYRPPVNKRVIEYPAGLVNDNGSKVHESMIKAAKRELLEETGYRAGKMVKLLQGPVSGGSSSDIVNMMLAIDLRKVSQGGGVELESIVVHEVPLKGVENWLTRMRRRGRLIEPKIYTGLYFLSKWSS